MSKTAQMEVSKLSLDLENFRTVPQKNEISAIKAMIAIKAERFFGTMESILEDEYLPTENIIVLNVGDKLIVKEGNRRIACLKIIQGIYDLKEFDIKSSIVDSIKSLTPEWKLRNASVPCSIYTKKEENIVDKIVSRTHGKGEQAARDKWSSVATARHNRDAKGVQEFGLDLLEKYLKHGKNSTEYQRERWSGDYPLTVLNEALRFIHPKYGYEKLSDLTSKYPKVPEVKHIDQLLLRIGNSELGFKEIRDSNTDFSLEFGVKPPAPQSNAPTNSNTGNTNNSTTTTGAASSTNNPTGPSTTNNSGTASAKVKNVVGKSYSSKDPKSVTALLKKFKPKAGRAKVATLKNELIDIKIEKNPLAFCFLLRSIFEISAKFYCKENHISLKTQSKDPKKKPQEKTLAELLKDVKKNLIANSTDNKKEKENLLHGATTELSRGDGILSVRSFNQLVHSENFQISPTDICLLFGNIFPLLDEMNK